MLDNIVIKTIEKNDFDAAKELVKSGLLEYGNPLFIYTTLRSATIQGLYFFAVCSLFWILDLEYLGFLFVLMLLELVSFRYVKTTWENAMKGELCDMSAWERFSEALRKDECNQFWVARTRESGDVIGTIGVAAFRKGDERVIHGCGWKLNWNIQFDNKEQIILEIKRLSISPAHRGTGLSKKLLNQVYQYVEALKEDKVRVSKIILFTNSVQFAAHKFYARNGFAIVNQAEAPFYKGLSYGTICLHEKKLD